MSEKRFTRIEFSNGIWGVKDNNIGYEYPSPIDLLDLLNELNEENKELKLQLEAFKDKLCELGVSDVKLYGKRYYTGLEEWLE